MAQSAAHWSEWSLPPGLAALEVSVECRCRLALRTREEMPICGAMREEQPDWASDDGALA